MLKIVVAFYKNQKNFKNHLGKKIVRIMFFLKI